MSDRLVSEILNDPPKVQTKYEYQPQLIEPKGPGPRGAVAKEGGSDQGGGGGGGVSTGQVQLSTIKSVHSVTIYHDVRGY